MQTATRNSRPSSRTTRLIAVAIALLFALPAGAAFAKKRGKGKRRFKTVLEFESRLKDENNKPVSGIFQMTFTLRRKKGKRRIWKESHWVAVDNGHYALQLGKNKKLPKRFDPDTTLIEVGISGAGVVLRQLVSGAGQMTQVASAPAGGRGIVKYAEKSGFAYDAEHAAVADRIGAYTGKLLQETLDKLKRKKAKVKVSRNRINLTSAGGVGGTPFEQICPPGTVVVGIRGGSGIYIDNFQVVCAPLQ